MSDVEARLDPVAARDSEQLADRFRWQCEGVAAAHILLLLECLQNVIPAFIRRSWAAQENPARRSEQKRAFQEYASMDGATAGAVRHIRTMEKRIEQQSTLIVELQKAGKDTNEAINRLVLLRNALEEMRIQLLGLLPTEAQDRLRASR